MLQSGLDQEPLPNSTPPSLPPAQHENLRGANYFAALEDAHPSQFLYLLARLSRIEVLVIDDWAIIPMQETERRDFWEICEDRDQRRSTTLTSQLPVSKRHERLGDPTVAVGIRDRLVHNAHRIEMRGESMRKTKPARPERGAS